MTKTTSDDRKTNRKHTEIPSTCYDGGDEYSPTDTDGDVGNDDSNADREHNDSNPDADSSDAKTNKNQLQQPSPPLPTTLAIGPQTTGATTMMVTTTVASATATTETAAAIGGPSTPSWIDHLTRNLPPLPLPSSFQPETALYSDDYLDPCSLPTGFEILDQPSPPCRTSHLPALPNIPLTPSLGIIKVLHPFVEKQFPFLLPLITNQVSLLFIDESGTKCDKLTELASQGIYDKNFLKCLFEAYSNDEEVHHDSTKFEDKFSKMKYARIAFLVTDQDKGRNIFDKEALWYYLPPLCQKLDNAKPALMSTEGMEYLSLCFVACPINLTPYQMPWLVGLLHEFCCPGKISISSTLSKGNVGGKEVRIELKDDLKCDISIFWSPSNLQDTSHAAILASAIIDVVGTSPIMSEFLKLQKIEKIDQNGIPDADYDLDKAVRTAKDELMKISEKDKEWRMNRRGSSQELSHSKTKKEEETHESSMKTVPITTTHPLKLPDSPKPS